MSRTNNGRHPNSLKNLLLTPEERRANALKLHESKKVELEKKNKELWEKMVAEGVIDIPYRKAAVILGVSKHQVLRTKHWAKMKGEAQEA